ncbi:MAG: hypothetical protein BWY22_02056 [Bacteroidetes bacterium ADurb.Bin217]|nr:MAG: hypothetical protein BWY22_02056 [Bacteroidetes bacterium ADurb.Bin217]
MVNISNDMKKPNTPDDNKISEIKNSRGNSLVIHDEKTPANTTIDVSIIIATAIPSTPIS